MSVSRYWKRIEAAVGNRKSLQALRREIAEAHEPEPASTEMQARIAMYLADQDEEDANRREG